MTTDGKLTDRQAFSCLGAVMFFIACLATAIAYKDFGFSPVGSILFGIGTAIFWLVVGMWMTYAMRPHENRHDGG
jgi:hypothetical protein